MMLHAWKLRLPFVDSAVPKGMNRPGGELSASAPDPFDGRYWAGQPTRSSTIDGLPDAPA
jgi:hypothetical protein